MPKRIFSLMLCIACLFLVLPETEFVSADGDVQSFSASSSSYSGPYVKVGDVTLPFAEHMPGTYFTKNGKTCGCHYIADCVASGRNCNCMRYYPTGDPSTCEIDLLAVQCFGFSRLVFYKCFGFLDHPNNEGLYYSVGSLSASEMSAETARDLLMLAAPGAHVRLKRGHSVSIMAMDENYLTVYHANSGGDNVEPANCVISTKRYTWAEFAEYAASGISYVNMPCKYPGSNITVTPKYTGYYKLTDNVNLRSNARISADIITVVPSGTILEVTEINGQWGKTSYNGSTGWLYLRYSEYFSKTSLEPAGNVFTLDSDGYLRAAAWKLNLEGISESFPEQNIVADTKTVAGGEAGYLGTGAVISLVINGVSVDSATLCLAGDINGDGIADSSDSAVIRDVVLRKKTLSGVTAEAGDVSGNGRINLNDYIMLRRYIISGDASKLEGY